MAWFVVNIVMFILIFTKKIEKIALLLPCLYIFDRIFSIIVGAITGAKLGIAALQSPVVGGLALLFPVIILGTAIYLISRK